MRLYWLILRGRRLRSLPLAWAAAVSTVAAALLLVFGSLFVRSAGAGEGFSATDLRTGHGLNPSYSGGARVVLLEQTGSRRRTLFAWASFRASPSIGVATDTFRGKRVVKRLRRGVYPMLVSDHGLVFHLVGPGIDRKNFPPTAAVVAWTVRLKPGTYRYFADFASNFPRGSFTVY